MFGQSEECFVEEEIVSVTSVGVEETYDLEIDSEEHTFLANDISVSNSHSASYSIISYQCAFLAHYYTAEWAAAFLEREDGDKKEKALSIVKSMGFTIKPLDINTSGNEWLVSDEDDKTLVQPLTSIKGLGPAAVDEILLRRPFNTVEDLLFNENISYMRLNKGRLDVLARSGALDCLIDSRFNHLKHFWLSCVAERPKNVKQLRENIESTKLEPDFERAEKIDFLTTIVGMYPLDLVISQTTKDRFAFTKVPPISEFDKSIGVCWVVPKKMEVRKTKTNRPYYLVELIDSNFVLTSIRCWNINVDKDRIFLHHVYLLKPQHNDKWGFSTSGPIPRNWKLVM